MEITEDLIANIRGDMTDRDAPNSDWPETWDSRAGYRYLAERLNEILNVYDRDKVKALEEELLEEARKTNKFDPHFLDCEQDAGYPDMEDNENSIH
jgi:hypothetical protein